MPADPKFILLDRDGVVNEDRPDYVKGVNELRIFPWTPAAITRACQAGYSIAVVSNQQGVALGQIDETSLMAIEAAISDAVRAAGGEIAAFRYCRHRKEDGCACRKPQPGMILDLAAEFGFDPAGTYFVGDTSKDLLAADAAGCQFVLVLSGHTPADRVASLPHAPAHVCAHLGEAVDWILDSPL